MNERMKSENLEKETLAREVQLEKETREREFQLECLRIKQNIVVTKSVELFERQAKVLHLPKDQWVTYLIGVLPIEVNNIIAREPEEQASDYDHIKEVLLKRFKLSAEKFRQLLVKTQKNSDATWYDFYHELKTFLDGWLNGLKIEVFEQLKDLMLVDQIKRRTPNEFKEHFLHKWATITSPKNLVGKIEEFEDAKKTIGGKWKLVDHKLRTADRQISDNHSHDKIFKGSKTFQDTHFRNYKYARNSGKTPELNFDKRKRLQCYECGSFNHLRPQCPNLKTQKAELCRIGVKSEGSLLDPYTSKGKVNGFRMQF
ncbi:retrovirus-related Pol polyprotein from transposon 17.6 [Trichonephila inaurata madagascariensis]|uniref:Retrovirus-related Pol polyprotein from transposon 17.6 n=1 Tax=Trichonephila inaurata madagascariensis TaxID=2747483 RepID=A0A8X6XVF0_9ARAC|nr:retrovirus-related Pol polyprotein from transposon 17.6 [Trichonephila inaurata madagascariensis]